VELCVFKNFASVAEQVMVKELLFHFALQEGFDCLLEIRLIALVDKEVELMAVMIRKIPIFLVGTQSVPLFDKVEGAEFPSVGFLDFSDFTEDLRHLGQVVNYLHFSGGDVFDEV
jgi:hypothetical protein